MILFIRDLEKKLIKSVFRSMRKLKTALTLLSGLVGDIELNKRVLREFIIHSLGMKPGFVNRFVSLNYNLVSLHVCVSLSLPPPAPDSIRLIISLPPRNYSGKMVAKFRNQNTAFQLALNISNRKQCSRVEGITALRQRIRSLNPHRDAG